MSFLGDDYLSTLNLVDEFPAVAPEVDLGDFSGVQFFDFDVGADGLERKFVPPARATPAAAVTPLAAATPAARSVEDEDKRRRNTQASARFRVKKKMREQEMEKQAAELALKVESLQATIKRLEMENSCLKLLIVQRNAERDNDLVEDIKKRSLA